MNAEVIVDGHPSCMPMNFKSLPKMLQNAGWRTSAYGKYDAGMTCWGCTPTCRGFDHFSGFYNAFNDYFTHRVGKALDLRNDFDPDMQDSNHTGVYMTELISQRVTEWISSTTMKEPERHTFAYVAHQAIHGPNQVPLSYIEGECKERIPLNRPIRRIMCGMMKAVDESVKNITQTYKDLGILNDTFIIFTTDNGGNPDTGGSNWPLRGQKATTFEGGVRGLGFVSGAGVAPSMRGEVLNEMIHVADWFPTIVGGIAQLNLTNLTKPGMPAAPALDGIDQWNTITTGSPSKRTEMLLNLIPTGCQGKNCKIFGQLAVRSGNYKLLYGHTSVWAESSVTPSSWCTSRNQKTCAPPSCSLPVSAPTSPPWCPNGWTPPPETGRDPQPPPDVNCTSLPCRYPSSPYIVGGVFLYDVVKDPFETTNIADEHPEIVKELFAKLSGFNATHIPQNNPQTDPASNPAKFGEIWTPWRGDPVPQHCDTNDTVPALKSAFDGLMFNGSTSSCYLQGWAWDPSIGKGYTALNVSLSADGVHITTVTADLSRPNLIPKTGAPNAQHGFQFQLNSTTCTHLSAGVHRLSAAAVTSSYERALTNSPRCYNNEREEMCSS
eukprot:m.190091 g.190091  ORF g.190091 m.190091 type:complete len:606 (+) comp13633_c0_seq1:177-1994(+)